jgi:hypothetical protein
MTNQTNIDDELRKTIENDLARFVQEHLDTWCRDVLSTADHAGIERLNACSLLAYWLTSMASRSRPLAAACPRNPLGNGAPKSMRPH